MHEYQDEVEGTLEHTLECTSQRRLDVSVQLQLQLQLQL